jgi:hypothetical protein
VARLVTVNIETSNALTGGHVVPLNIHTDENVHVGVAPVSGAPTVNIEFTFQNPLEDGVNPTTFVWYPVTALTSVSTTVAGQVPTPVHAIRVVQPTVGNSRVFILQGGIAQ